MKKSIIASSASVVFLLGLSPQLQAISCADSYVGSGLTVLEGATVCFLYDAADVSPLYGNLTVSGDNIFSNPDAFIASSANGGSTQTTGIGTVRVAAKDGYDLSIINILERGNYRLSGAGSSVDLDASLDIFSTDSPLFDFSTSALSITGDLSLQDSNLHNFSASTSFDLNTVNWLNTNDIGLTLTNILTATTIDIGETATIEKNLSGTQLVSIVTTPTAVPIPASIWLFGAGLFAMTGFIRRRK